MAIVDPPATPPASSGGYYTGGISATGMYSGGYITTPGTTWTTTTGSTSVPYTITVPGIEELERKAAKAELEVITLTTRLNMLESRTLDLEAQLDAEQGTTKDVVEILRGVLARNRNLEEQNNEYINDYEELLVETITVRKKISALEDWVRKHPGRLSVGEIVNILR
jgi:hypothetical protein